jgi:hypothetical protein
LRTDAIPAIFPIQFAPVLAWRGAAILFPMTENNSGDESEVKAFGLRYTILVQRERRPSMKNVTITLTPEVARWARIRAAENETSVSRMVGEMLREQMEEESRYTEAMAQFLSFKPTALKRKVERYPSRDELHER